MKNKGFGKRIFALVLASLIAMGGMVAFDTNGVYADSEWFAEGTTGMTVETNIVLRFAQEIGFDSKAYLSSPSAWKIVNGTANGFWRTEEGKKITKKGPAYAAGVAVGGYDDGKPIEGLWEDCLMKAGVSNWRDFNKFIHKKAEDGGGVMCAGLVTVFMNYIRTHNYDDIYWKTYYDAYNKGFMKGYDSDYGNPHYYGPNNVVTVFAGSNGIYSKAKNKTDVEFVGYTVQKNTPESTISKYFDTLAPGGVIIFGSNYTDAKYPEPIVNGKYVKKNSWNNLNGRYHAAIYLGKKNGLHWMLDTDTYAFKPRIRAIEYYAMNYTKAKNTGASSVKITRIAGMKIPDAFNKKINGLTKDSDKVWKYMKYGLVDKNYNYLAKSPKNGKWYYCENGVVDRTYRGLAKSPKNGKLYYCRKGKIYRKFTGLARYKEDGKLYYCVKGIASKKYTGLARFKEDGKWYYCKKGVVDESYTGLGKSPKTKKWYYCNKGVVDYSYNGLAKSPKNGHLYYCKNGIVDYSFNGIVKDQEGKEHHVVKGRALN